MEFNIILNLAPIDAGRCILVRQLQITTGSNFMWRLWEFRCNERHLDIDKTTETLKWAQRPFLSKALSHILIANSVKFISIQVCRKLSLTFGITGWRLLQIEILDCGLWKIDFASVTENFVMKIDWLIYLDVDYGQTPLSRFVFWSSTRNLLT